MNTRTHLRTAWGVVRRLRTLAIIAVTMHFDYFYLHVLSTPFSHPQYFTCLIFCSWNVVVVLPSFPFSDMFYLQCLFSLVSWWTSFFPSYLRPSSCLLILSSFHGSSCPFSIFFLSIPFYFYLPPNLFHITALIIIFHLCLLFVFPSQSFPAFFHSSYSDYFTFFMFFIASSHLFW